MACKSCQCTQPQLEHEYKQTHLLSKSNRYQFPFILSVTGNGLKILSHLIKLIFTAFDILFYKPYYNIVFSENQDPKYFFTISYIILKCLNASKIAFSFSGGQFRHMSFIFAYIVILTLLKATFVFYLCYIKRRYRHSIFCLYPFLNFSIRCITFHAL